MSEAGLTPQQLGGPRPGDDEPASYVVRVRGALGPAVLASLPGRLAGRVQVETRWVVVTELSDADVVDVVQWLVEHGLESAIESVRELPPRR